MSDAGTRPPAAAPGLRVVPDPDTAGFWERAEQGEFTIQRCRACGRLQYPIMPRCRGCGSEDIDLVGDVSQGRLYSYIVVHHPVMATHREIVPYTVGVVELDEHARVLVRVDLPRDEVEVGMSLAVRAVPGADGPLLVADRPPGEAA